MRKSIGLLALAALAAGCGSDETPPVCRDACQPAGTQVCTDAGVEQCQLGPDGCTAWSVVEQCAAGAACAVQDGTAACTSCVEGATRCASVSSLETCTGGRWVASTCADGCTSTSTDASCATPGLTTLEGTLQFEARVPNDRKTDWSRLSTYRAQGFTVISRGAGGVYDTTTTTTTVDATDTTAGTFRVKVPLTPTADDELVFLAAGYDDSGKLAYCVASPGFTTSGTQSESATPPDPAVWSWSRPLAGLTSGSTITITDPEGSGAAEVYENLRLAYTSTRSVYGAPGQPVVVWVQYGTSWSCGACFSNLRTPLFGGIQAQIWLDGSDQDEGYWSDAVTQHELGHWAMWAYGLMPFEGGVHYLGVPTYPGQAWAEGWATYFSSDLRNSSVYVDKQGGAMFWLDLAARTYSDGITWQRPVPSDSWLGLIDENEVAAMAWSLRQSSSSAEDAMFQAIASSRLTTSPFPRGYTQHTWDVSSTGEITNPSDTGVPAPCFADFLDALECAGFPDEAVVAATEPTVHYAYAYEYPYTCP